MTLLLADVTEYPLVSLGLTCLVLMHYRRSETCVRYNVYVLACARFIYDDSFQHEAPRNEGARRIPELAGVIIA